MKAAELTKLTVEELNKELKDLKDELFRLRFQHSINQLDNPNKIPETKRNIARVMTAQVCSPIARNAGEKRLAAGGCLQACTGKDRVSFHTGGAPARKGL